MDYEKKYKEALEKARELDIKGIHIMRDVFPELEEPKDEKIRLSLINWIINDNQETFVGLKSSDVIEWLKKQKTPEWSEEDKEIIETICKEGDLKPSERVWLRSLKPQPKQEWSEEDEKIYQSIMDDTVQENQLDGKQTDWLRNIKYRNFARPQKQWKPTEEQMKAFEHFVRSVGESGYASPYDNNTKLLYSLLKQLKQL